MRVAAVDVGSNTIRLLVARVDRGIEPLESERVRLSLGAEIEQTGVVSDVSVAAAAKAVRKLCARARGHSVDALDVFLTAPGRQSENAGDLVAALSRAASHPVRVLTTVEEGRLAYLGAVATADVALVGTVAVCDVGGASTEIAIGDAMHEPTWVRSVDLGSVRLTARADHAGEVAAAFNSISPPPVDVALAVGGSARAARRLVGPWLGEEELAAAMRIVEAKSERAITRRYGVHKSRVGILGAGITLLAEVRRRLGVPLHVCSGGIREGAVLESVRALRAA
jgi:exopolyphosphatase / guanosine-5'-triphosphate,3'-diphosphate pyrophosphatase